MSLQATLSARRCRRLRALYGVRTHRAEQPWVSRKRSRQSNPGYRGRDHINRWGTSQGLARSMFVVLLCWGVHCTTECNLLGRVMLMGKHRGLPSNLTALSHLSALLTLWHSDQRCCTRIPRRPLVAAGRWPGCSVASSEDHRFSLVANLAQEALEFHVALGEPDIAPR